MMSREESLTMGAGAISEPASSESDRLGENDLDLLTFTEVGIRLDAEIRSLLDQSGEMRAAGNADEELLARLDKRLADLRAARGRLRRPKADA